MFCHRCGVRLADDALFCMKCGAKRPFVDGDDAHDEDEERDAAADSIPPVQDAKPMPRTMPDSDNRALTLGRMTPAQLIALLKPLDDQFAQISALENDIHSAYDAMNSNRNEYYAGVVCFLISGFIGAMAMVYALVSEPWNHQAPVTALVACLVALIPLLIGLNQIRVYRHNVDDATSLSGRPITTFCERGIGFAYDATSETNRQGMTCVGSAISAPDPDLFYEKITSLGRANQDPPGTDFTRSTLPMIPADGKAANCVSFSAAPDTIFCSIRAESVNLDAAADPSVE